ncbi:class F sortase [Candidatus Saccharibacteria bacterium]|nr:class F sortase [Candidatus Saccharibacteria bacterium]
MTISKMSLKIATNWKLIVRWIFTAILGILFLVFFVRVAVFEDAYYREMEGSERDVAEQVSEEEELSEEVPTEDEITEYTVAADRPRYLSIEKLGISNARVIAVGVKANGELGTPNNIFDVGWYESSGKPGQGGTLVIDGHNGGPHVYGVFKNLPNLKNGDFIIIERGDGEKFRYRVVENVTVALSDADMYMATAMRSPEAGKESVTLISCTGEWSQQQKTYLSRQFVRAVLE